MAGELLVQAEQYREARLHLRMAAQIEPTHAQTYYFWGLAFERDPHGCDYQAAKKFGKAIKLAPEDPKYRAALGRAAVRSDRKKRGIRELHAAAGLAPGDVAVIRVVTEGLIEAGQLKMAGRVLNRARFLSFESSKDRELVALMERVWFESARCEQREAKRHRQDADFARDGGRMVIPFIRKVKRTGGGTGPKTNGSTRRDVVSLPKPHFPRLRIGRADR
jgi:tetratricopeptide (TPR) repeat protein